MADEPTTGLDSAAAERVALLLKDLAGSGAAVICTVHQPNSEIFRAFDDVIIMVDGGRVAYAGSKERMMHFFRWKMAKTSVV